MRTATRKVNDNGDKFLHKAQATVWKDKKQVAFLHNTGVENSVGHTVKRWVKTNMNHERINTPRPSIGSDYSSHMGGVDQADGGIAQWSVSLRTK